ncbi:hypothetical protein ATKI12_6307 [Kitasatospora sp. Ki12]
MTDDDAGAEATAEHDRVCGTTAGSEPAESVMITTSLRLPKPVMDEVRRRARERGLKPTAIMREWIEAAIADTDEPLPLSVIAAAVARYQQHRKQERAARIALTFEQAPSWDAVGRAERMHEAEKRSR